MTPKYHHYRTAPRPVSNRVRCPVCDEEVYSLAGIHPQCAVRQCDPPRAKDRGARSAPRVERVSVAIEASEIEVIPVRPATIKLFDPFQNPA